MTSKELKAEMERIWNAPLERRHICKLAEWILRPIYGSVYGTDLKITGYRLIASPYRG